MACLIVVCALFSYWYQTSPESEPESVAIQADANLTSFTGEIQVLRARSADWVSVSREASVGVGDTVRTGPDAYATVTYPDGRDYLAVALLALRDGLVHREVTYWSEPFEAPPWRSQWVERTA